MSTHHKWKFISDTLDPWIPVRDLIYVRELPVEQEGLIISPVDLNTSTDNTKVLQGIVEAVGPGRISEKTGVRITPDVKVGDKVWFEIGAGVFRMPGDDDVRLIEEKDLLAVEQHDN
jgi:co-chaperonin GroES (HSP10)